MSAASEVADWIARGRAHQREGRPVDALLCFRRASRADPRAADPHFVLGEALWQLGRLPEAVGAWQEAARVDPAFLAPWQAISEALLATGDDARRCGCPRLPPRDRQGLVEWQDLRVAADARPQVHPGRAVG